MDNFGKQGKSIENKNLGHIYTSFKGWTVWPQSEADKWDDDGIVSGLEFLPGHTSPIWMGFLSTRGNLFM